MITIVSINGKEPYELLPEQASLNYYDKNAAIRTIGHYLNSKDFNIMYYEQIKGIKENNNRNFHSREYYRA